MLDAQARKLIDPALARLGRMIAGWGISANAVTVVAFLVGVAAAGAIAAGWFLTGALLVALSRLGDGLDGAVAGVNGRTDLGGYLDIVLDFAFYGLVPLGFVLADPAANGVAGAVLLAAFYANGASFLAYAVMAEKHGLSTDRRGKKSLFFTTGLAEATETIAVFLAMCLWPGWFAVLAYGFAGVTVYTTLSRIVLAARTFP